MSGFEKIISVIVPFYNADNTIKKCLDSLKAQTFDADKTEILLVNDGSTDGSADIVRDFAVDAANVSVITQEHRGLSEARNCGITAARGKYIAFLDADDTLSDNTLEKIVDFFEENYEAVDLVTYKLVPYNNGNRKKSGFRYNDNVSRVKDLGDDDNVYLCPVGINIAVKNRGDENILFSVSENCDLETVNFCLDCVRDKKAFGYVADCEYRKMNNPGGVGKSLECSLFFNDFVGRWEEIFSEYDPVPGYVQSVFAEDILRRLKGDFLFPYHLEGEAYRREVERIEKLLEKTEDSIILNFPEAEEMNKYYLVSMKYKGELEASFDEKIRLAHGENILYEAEAFELVLTKFKARESTVEVCGYISSPVFDYSEKPVLLLRERSETVPLEIRECSFCYDGAKLRNNTAWGFRKIFEVGKRTSFSFAVEIADCSYPVHFSFGEWVPFNEKRSRFVLNGVSCKMRDKCIILEKADKKAEKKYKKMALKKYLRTNKKVFAVRLLNLILPKKRIWLYNDCKGVGVDNAYLQFIHDFDIDDGVERYYVVNGSVDEIRQHFTAEQQKRLISFRSSKHKMLYLNAEKIITAFVENENYLPFYSDIYPEYIDLFGGDVYYLQHGVLHAHVPWKYSYDRLDITGEVISTDYEVKNFTENYFFPEEALIKSKMPRYDRVDIDTKKAKNIILFAPSWRKYLISHKAGGGWTADKEKFVKSDFFKKTQEFLNSESLAKLLEENGWTLEFKLHPIFAPYKDCFDIQSPSVSFADGRPIDEYKIFITDFSSFVYDFVYLNRAVVYFMPDLREFKAGMNDYRELDIPFENGFGELTQSQSELCLAIERVIENNGEAISPYKERSENFFFDKDRNSCDRIYNAITE